MIGLRRFGFLCGAVVALSLVVSVPVQTSPVESDSSQMAQFVRRLAPGVWGGEGLRLDVAQNGADLEFDCARGRITEPLIVDSKGRFHAKGFFERQSGAIRKDSRPASFQTVYAGTVEGDTMQLEFTLPGDDGSGETRTKGPFTLVRGDSGHLRKCA